MKLITAVIKPFKFDEVLEALKAAGVKGMTVTEVKGFGRQSGHTETYRGAEYNVDLIPKTKVEILVEGDEVAGICDTIQRVAATGKIGDGKLWGVDVDAAIRLRTGETGADAL